MGCADTQHGQHLTAALQLPQRLTRVLPGSTATLCITTRPRDSQSPTAPDLACLAQQDPTRCILVIVSPAHLNAMQEDLLAAQRALRSPGALLLISSQRKRLPPALRGSLLRASARLLTLVRGPLQSLRLRAAGLLIDHAAEHDFQPAHARQVLTRLTAQAPAPPVHGRVPRSDPELLTFIRRELRCALRPSATGLLRRLRAQGYQCEQHRFQRLFQQLTSRHPQP